MSRRKARSFVVTCSAAFCSLLSSIALNPMPAQAATVNATLVATVQTSQLSPPSPDPAGIAYISTRDRLLISDSEVEEMAIFSGVNLFEITRSGALTDTGVTTAFTNEPTGVTFNPVDGHLFVSDDNQDQIYEVDPAADGRYGTGDDVVTSFGTSVFGNADPEGLALDTTSGALFIVDGVGDQVYRVSSGPNGRFDGVSPTGDDSVTNFDVGIHGAVDTPGIAYHAARGTLFVIDEETEDVFEVETTGALVNRINLSGVTPTRLDDIVLAPGSVDPSRTNMYIVDRVIDNNANANENDGRMYEMSVDLSPHPATTIQTAVAASSNDAEETPSGKVKLISTDLELVRDDGNQTVGMRFAGVSVPQGGIILGAHVQFRADEVQMETTSLTIAGQNSNNPGTFKKNAFNVSARPRTAAIVRWVPLPWITVNEAGPAQRTPDLSPVVQQIVNRAGWSSGNAMVLVITGTGRRTADSFEGGAAPVLSITYRT
jgi:hypothetical protein